MAHKNVIMIYLINSTNLVVARMTNGLMAVQNKCGPDNTNDDSVHSKCTKVPRSLLVMTRVGV